MFEIIDELIELLFQENSYQEFIKANQKIEDISNDLLLYQDISNEYYKMKKYEKYVGISEVKSKYIETKQQLEKREEVIEYYKSYHKLNDLLEELTSIIFDGISDELKVERYSL